MRSAGPWLPRRACCSLRHFIVVACTLAVLLHAQGQDTDARRLCEEAVTAAKEVLGVGHPHTQVFMNNPWGIR